MAVQRQHLQKSMPLDWDAGLREQVLEMVSDPASSVVAFPARRAPKTRHGAKTPAQIAMIPSPHDPREATGLRLVMRRKSRKGEATLSFSKTILGSMAIGLLIGGLSVQDRVIALSTQAVAVAEVAQDVQDPEVAKTLTALASSAPWPPVQAAH